VVPAPVCSMVGPNLEGRMQYAVVACVNNAKNGSGGTVRKQGKGYSVTEEAWHVIAAFKEGGAD